MSISTKKNHNSLLMFTLTLGVFGILNTEMGVVGIIPVSYTHLRAHET